MDKCTSQLLQEDDNDYDNLCQYSIEKCELCDMVFSSRFANIIHSTQHIIIPLIKHQIYQCKICLYCFTTKSELTLHKHAKHKNQDQNEVIERQINCESGINGEKSGMNYVKSDIHEKRSQIYYESSQFVDKNPIDHTRSQIDDRSQNNQHKSQILKELSQKESQLTNRSKKSATHKKSQNKKESETERKSQIEIESQMERESQIERESQKEDSENALLQSIIFKQPIVKLDNIGYLLSKKHQESSYERQKNHTKNSNNTQKDIKNDDKNVSTLKTSKKLQNPSQSNITNEIFPNKIILGDKKPIKRKVDDVYSTSERDKKSSTDSLERDSKPNTNGKESDKRLNRVKKDRNEGSNRRESDEIANTDRKERNKKPKTNRKESGETSNKNRKTSDEICNTDHRENENRLNSNIKVSFKSNTNRKESDRSDTNIKESESTVNGINITDLTTTNRHTLIYNYREASPGVISINSDSSDELQYNKTMSKLPSKRGVFDFKHDNDETNSNDIQIIQNKTSNVFDKDLTVDSKTASKVSNIKQKTTISSRLSFTEILEGIPSDNGLDEINNELLNNFTSPVKKSNFRSKLQFEDDENIKLLDEELTSLTYEFKSVHYDELMETELSECKRCHMIFMNRLSLYKHEMSHIRIKQPKRHYFCKYCEAYYAGNHLTQRKHYQTYHFTTGDKKKVFPCPVCKLQYYKLKDHYKKFHSNLYCKNCNTCFGSKKVYNEHNCSKTDSHVKIYSNTTQKQYDLLLVCDLCLSFTKNTANFKYEVVGEKCEVGERQKCFYCTKEFFDVKLVKRVNNMMLIKSLKEKKEDKKKTQCSKTEKLQMFQKRLKAMKK